MAITTIDILGCVITIGDENPNNPMVIDNPIVLNEVENIEIFETYKQLIGTASVVFPKGSVFKNTIIYNVTADNKPATSITTEMMQNGAVIEKRTGYQVINDKTFKVGQRINIKLGYNGNLKNMFDGYIVSYNSDSKTELQCENMAYKLKLEQCPSFETPVRGTTINDICEGKYNMLKGTGFSLHSETKKYKIEIGKVKTTDNFTIADVLNDWSKHHLYCYLKYDETTGSQMPSIAVGRVYSSDVSTNSFQTYSLKKPYEINFNYHVAANSLKVVKVDPKFLAVTGKGVGIDQKMYNVTVRLNPEYDPNDKSSKEFHTINATQISKKTHKLTGNITAEGAKTKTKVDLSTYTVVPYTSKKIGISSDDLVKETIEYFKTYNLNGISGDITIFGDYGLSTGVQVEIIDEMNPSKNGTYLVEEVTTTFGVNGYRQKLTLPYKIKGRVTYGDNNKDK